MSMVYESQIEDLLQQLTLEEKIGMIHGAGLFRTEGVERLGIPPLKMSDGPMGVRQEFANDKWIPLSRAEGFDDAVSYLASNSALAATWNPELAYASGKVLGAEARGRGKDVILAPGINIKRDPLCGRNFEYMSEDPYLIETLTVPFIKGVQENDVAACVKHFAANSQETDRHYVDTIVDERTLHEIYYPGFEAAVKKAGTYSLMNAYNRLNGPHCAENQKLLNQTLCEEWGYDGTVISDWGSVHTTKETAEAALDIEMSVKANFSEYYFATPLLEAVKAGEVKEADIDKKVRNVLRMMYRLKMLGEDANKRQSGANNTVEHQQAIRKVAEEGIVLLKNEENILPLKSAFRNSNVQELQKAEVMQEDVEKQHSIAVIGHNAAYCHAGGGGSAEIHALYEISPLEGLKKALGDNVTINYTQGYYIPGDKEVNEVNWQAASLERQVMGEEDVLSPEQQALREEIAQKRAKLLEEACEAAKTADTVIFIGGLNHDYDVEGRDRKDMKLPYGQDELIDALLEINPNMILVMVAGSPVEMPWLRKAKALVWCYYSGMETGNALADILLGKVNPSAKLPETFPVKYADTVTAKNGQFGLEGKVVYEESVFIGYRYYERDKITPAFSFGHGLSYTQFSMENLQISAEFGRKASIDRIVCEEKDSFEGELAKSLSTTEIETPVMSRNVDYDNWLEEKIATVKVTVANIGATEGAEVVQCYVTDCECSVERPVKELKAYQKVLLQPGEQQEVVLVLSRKAFAFYDVATKRFVTEPGKFLIHIGNAADHCTLCAEIEI